GDASGACVLRLMVMVRCRVVFTRQVTRSAEGIAFDAELSAMRVVAVAAGDTIRIHFALQERTPVIDLAALLAVGVIKRICQQRRTIVIKKRPAGFVALCDLAAPRVTLRADFDLALGCTRLRAHRIAGRRVLSPRDATPLIETCPQPLGAIASIGFFPLF